MEFNIKVNGTTHAVDVDADTPVLWALRDNLHLSGTKYGCGISVCGACTVLVDGVAMRSCSLSIADVGDAEIVSIEGLSSVGMSALQDAWVEEDVPQCGYCQSGQIMAAAALLSEIKKPDDSEIDAAMTNICRCGTYSRIKKAIHRVVAER
jgi:isoquinoline 1-oxidoreductase alpha subunit